MSMSRGELVDWIKSLAEQLEKADVDLEFDSIADDLEAAAEQAEKLRKLAKRKGIPTIPAGWEPEKV